MDTYARYRAAIKKHLESQGLHGFKTVHRNNADTEAWAAVASADGTYFYLHSEGRLPNRRYTCRYGDTLEPVMKPSLGDIAKLEAATPLPFTSMWGVVENGNVVELYWFEGPVAFNDKPGAPRVLALVCKERAAENLLRELWKPSKLLDIPTFWRLVANKKLVPVARTLRSQGHVKMCEFQIGGKSATGVLTGGNLLLHPGAWQAAPGTTPATAKNLRPVVLVNE
ncbi:MAG TPA: hypothetical protein VFZ48_01295 [Candidatus Saccharimonadales bacterium]